MVFYLGIDLELTLKTVFLSLADTSFHAFWRSASSFAFNVWQ